MAFDFIEKIFFKILKNCCKKENRVTNGIKKGQFLSDFVNQGAMFGNFTTWRTDIFGRYIDIF